MLAGCQRRLLLGALSGWLLALSLAAQGPTTGAFAGTVRDEAGRPLAGATIIIRSLDHNLEWQTHTDKKGSFYHGGFRPGRYLITLLRDQHVLWSGPFTLSHFEQAHPVEIDLKKLREAAEQARRLDPELERRLQAEREQRAREEKLESHYTLGARHLEQDRPEEALQEFQAALEMEPNRHVLYGLLGTAAAAAGRRDAAIRHYRRALELAPGEAAHHNNLGTLLVEEGQLDEALVQFQQAAQLDPDRAATYHFNRGAALLNAGHPGEALAPLREAVRRDPTLAVAHYFLGLASFRTSPRRATDAGGERVEPRPGTVEAFQRYLELAPDGDYAERAREILKELGVTPFVAPRSP